jgi:hypothetical protein
MDTDVSIDGLFFFFQYVTDVFLLSVDFHCFWK